MEACWEASLLNDQRMLNNKNDFWGSKSGIPKGWYPRLCEIFTY